MALLALLMLPILSFQQTLTEARLRQQNAYDRITLQRNALAVLRDVNPTARPQGEIELDALHRLRWTAQPLSAPARSVGYPVGDGKFEVALYRLDAQIVHIDGRLVARFEVEQLGWRELDVGERRLSDRPGR